MRKPTAIELQLKDTGEIGSSNPFPLIVAGVSNLTLDSNPKKSAKS